MCAAPTDSAEPSPARASGGEVDGKSAWFVGSGGLAGRRRLRSRDGQMPGERITYLEHRRCRAAHWMDDRTRRASYRSAAAAGIGPFRMPVGSGFRSIPVAGVGGQRARRVLLAEQGRPPISSLQRATIERGKPAPGTAGKPRSTRPRRRTCSRSSWPRARRWRTSASTRVFGEDFFASNFWMLAHHRHAFQEWHSALKLYLHRFIHYIGGLPDLSRGEVHPLAKYESWCRHWCMMVGTRPAWCSSTAPR
ncbi:oleate hydratase [Enterobacter kobei]|uniref:oleate hydratase n=1 Tax=Enterobacter kobei TaxID=208224 RepID=UPI003D075BAA